MSDDEKLKRRSLLNMVGSLENTVCSPFYGLTILPYTPRPHCGYDTRGYVLIQHDWTQPVLMPDSSFEFQFKIAWDTNWSHKFFPNDPTVRAIKIKLKENYWYRIYLYRRFVNDGLRLLVTPFSNLANSPIEYLDGIVGKNNWLFLGPLKVGKTFITEEGTGGKDNGLLQ